MLVGIDFWVQMVLGGNGEPGGNQPVWLVSSRGGMSGFSSTTSAGNIEFLRCSREQRSAAV